MSGYSVASLKAGIEAAKKNIQTFEDAISKERSTIQEYYDMIDVIERKKREAAAREQMKQRIEVVAEEDDG